MAQDQHKADDNLILKNEVYQIVGAAMEVSAQLGCGFLEAVYQEALGIEFSQRNIPHQAQKHIAIFYKRTELSKAYIADFVCYDSIIVELKAISNITKTDEAQLLNYLKATQMPVGLLLNFGAAKLQWKRYANTNPGLRAKPGHF